MAEKENKIVEEQSNSGETVSKAEYDAVVAELVKYQKAVNKLVNAMAQRYAQDIVKEALTDDEQTTAR